MAFILFHEHLIAFSPFIVGVPRPKILGSNQETNGLGLQANEEKLEETKPHVHGTIIVEKPGRRTSHGGSQVDWIKKTYVHVLFYGCSSPINGSRAMVRQC